MSNPSLTTDALTGPFDQFQSLVLEAADVESFLAKLTALAPTFVDPAASCGINLYRDGRPVAALSSDDRAAQLDETQYELDEGPCLQALQTGAEVYVADTADERRWSHYMQLARDDGLRSSLSLPLTADRSTVGAINLFAFDRADAFDPARRERGQLFARQAGRALELVDRLARSRRVQGQLEQALASSATINQALGIVMAEQRCQADEAFAILRGRSQNGNRKLRDVAADLVASTSGRPPAAGSRFELAGRVG